MIKKQCSEPMCATLIPARQKPPYCEKHLKGSYQRQNVNRDPKTTAFYKSLQWVNFRKSVMAEHSYMCYPCRVEEGRYIQAKIVHHIKPISTKEGWELRLSRESVFPVCDSCHNKIHTEKGGNHW